VRVIIVGAGFTGTKIIAAYAGTGKSHFASLYPELTIDLVCMPY